MTKIPYVRLIKQFAESTPHRTIIHCDGETLSCLELERYSNQWARAYTERGVNEGDLVTICLPNGFEYFIACMAAWKLGAVPNPLSSGLPDSERNAIIAQAKPALLVGVEEAAGDDYPVLLPDLVSGKKLSEAGLAEKIAPHERALASGGSTGRPKLIIPGNPALYDIDNPPQLFTPRNAMLVPGPLYHAGPYSAAWGAIFAGGTAVVMSRFDAAHCLQLIEQHSVDRVFFVPTMLNRIWHLPEEERLRYDLSSLEFVVSGGAPCPPWLMRAWIEWLGPERMFEGYGPSERIGRTFITGAEWLKKPGSVGRPMDGCHIKILDEQEREVVAGQIGEIYMMPATGPGSTFSYQGAERRITADGWESAGDMGYLDEDGYLFIADRRTDMILCGGRNIYPAEIEGALNAHSEVRSSVIIGLPDDDLGQRIHAIVECDREIAGDILRKHLEPLLVRYKWPHSFEYVSYPLFNEAGKVRRSALRAERIDRLKTECE